jgi:hypothetical protein
MFQLLPGTVCAQFVSSPAGCFGGEINVNRTVVVDFQPLGLATNAWELLVRLKHRPRLVVVDDHGPEISDRNVRWQVQFVGLGAIPLNVKFGKAISVARGLAPHPAGAHVLGEHAACVS